MDQNTKTRMFITIDIGQTIDVPETCTKELDDLLVDGAYTSISTKYKGTISEGGGIPTPITFEGNTEEEREEACFRHLCDTLSQSIPFLICQHSKSSVDFLAMLSEVISQVFMTSAAFISNARFTDVDLLVTDVANLVKKYVVGGLSKPSENSVAPPTSPTQPSEPSKLAISTHDSPSVDSSKSTLPVDALEDDSFLPSLAKKQIETISTLSDETLRRLTKNKEPN